MTKLNTNILQLAIPSIISNITVPLLGLIDIAIIGHIGNESYIGAISIGTMIFNIIYLILCFLRMGTSGLTSQAYGENDWKKAISILFRALTIGIVMGGIFIIMQDLLQIVMLNAMNTPKTSWNLVTSYVKITIWGAPAMLGLYALMGWFIGMQNTKIPMIIAIVQNIINIIASLFFVYVIKWDINGVASGTLIAQWCGFIIAITTLLLGIKKSYFFNTNNIELISLKIFVVAIKQKKEWNKFFSINRDIFLRTFCFIAVNMFFTSAGGKQGSMILAVNTLLMTMFTLFSYFMDGFAYAGEAISGKFYGEKNFKMINVLTKRLLLFGILMILIFTSIYIIGGDNLLRLLTNNIQIVEAAKPYIVWAYFIPIIGMAAFIYDGIFIGITETKGMLFSSFIAMTCFFLFYITTNQMLKNNSLWIAFLIFLFMRGVCQAVWLKRKNFRQISKNI